MHPSRLCPIVLVALYGGILGSASFADVDGFPRLQIAREHHAWARFSPGAWRTAELISETIDSGGRVESRTVTTRRTLLEELDNQRYSLRRHSAIRTHGRQINGPSQIYWHNLFADDGSDVRNVELDGQEKINLSGRPVLCQVLQVRLSGKLQPVLSTIYYSRRVAPFILRRVSRESAVDAPADSAWQTIEEVVAVDMPYCFRNARLSTAHIRKVTTTAKGKTVRMAVVSATVPGGVVSEWSKELDKNGRVLRRSYLNLVDYGSIQSDRGPGRGRRLDRRGR